jgi:hypothetical protein
MPSEPADVNIDQLRRNRYPRVRLRPSAVRDQPNGMTTQHGDVWILTRGSANGLAELSNTATGHVAELGCDHIHHFDADPLSSTSVQKHGFLTLTAQIHLQGPKLWIEPMTRRRSAAAPVDPRRVT